MMEKFCHLSVFLQMTTTKLVFICFEIFFIKLFLVCFVSKNNNRHNNHHHHHHHRNLPKSATPTQPVSVPNQEHSFMHENENNDQQVSISEVSAHEASTEKEMSPKDFQLELTKLKYNTKNAGTGRQSMAFSFDTIDTGQSSDDDKSNGSEFGECVSAKDLKNKLPQVEKDISEMLKLKVSTK